VTTVVGAVLVGGASSRMGTDKALLPLEGAAMAHRVVAALVAGGATAIEVIGGDPAIARALDLSDLIDGWGARDDLWKGIGPIGGLATAVIEARPPATSDPGPLPANVEAATAAAARDDVIVVVAACDQPDLTGAVVDSLVQALLGADPTAVASAVRTADGRRHPFPSAWRAAAGPALAQLVAGGSRRADAAFGIGGVADVAAPGEALEDLDTPDDVRRWHDRRGPSRPGAPGHRA